MTRILIVSLLLLSLTIFSPEDVFAADKDVESVYSWIKNLQLENGLLESSDDSNFVSLYENALAAIVFSAKGDFKRAEKVFDFFVRDMDELKTAPGGFGQFRDRDGIPLNGVPHRWLGDNAWLLIAINNYRHLAGNNKYADLSSALEGWMRSLQDPQDGGLWGGYEQSGKRIHKVTEGIIDAFNAVKGYDDFHKEILSFLKAGYWDTKKKVFIAWKGNKKYQYALDLHSWGYCALPDMPPQILDEAAMHIATKKATVNGKEITGFCFDTDNDTIWLEGTGEMVVAYRSAGKDPAADHYIAQLEKMITPSPKDPALAGIPYATNPGTGYATGRLWEGADKNLSLTSSAWYLLGKLKYDPMATGRKKKIPAADMFWLK